MAIPPVHTSTTAATPAVHQAKKPTPQTGHATTDANPALQAQQSTAAPKPVVNGQGQTTGKIVNATA